MDGLTFFNIFSIIVWIISIIGVIVNSVRAYKEQSPEIKKYHLYEIYHHLLVIWICVFARWIVYFITNK